MATRILSGIAVLLGLLMQPALGWLTSVQMPARPWWLSSGYQPTPMSYRRSVGVAATTATTSTESNISKVSASAASVADSAVVSTSRAAIADDEGDDQSVFVRSLRHLTNKSSDIRGRFVDHSTKENESTLNHVAEAIRGDAAVSLQNRQPALTPLAAYFIGQALATQLRQTKGQQESQLTIGIGMDPRPHGRRLAYALASGIESVPNVGDTPVRAAVCRGMATTPACASFCRSNLCDTAVMVTASHLPRDRNGFKFFAEHAPSGFSKTDIQSMGALAESLAQTWCEPTASHLLPQALCTSINDDGSSPFHMVDWMPIYEKSLKDAIVAKTSSCSSPAGPLGGLKVVLNSGNGAGGFFQNVLLELGANVSASIHLEPDGDFPNGIPNPEDLTMLQQTIAACQVARADLGIMLDTDADRCGFVVPRTTDSNDGTPVVTYEALNRNRLIALLGVVFAREKPGCAVVTDSVTSEGLSTFLQDNLGLKHERFIKGYANVINRARELTESGAMNAELAIETSGHCAMRENGYLDDGTYTAVQVVSLLARERAAACDSPKPFGLLDLIAAMEELDEVCELRMSAIDGSLETMRQVFDQCVAVIERQCSKQDDRGDDRRNEWSIDVDNLEGIRLRLGNGQFFMLRKSLHDPIISLQIEARDSDEARERIVQPILHLFSEASIGDVLDLGVLTNY